MGKNKKKKINDTALQEQINDSGTDSINDMDATKPDGSKDDKPVVRDISEKSDEKTLDTVDRFSDQDTSEDNAVETSTEARESSTEAEEGKNKKKKRPKKDIYAYTKDIWYRGPLSYRHLKLLGWLCIVLSQVGNVLAIGNKMGMDLEVPVFSNSSLMTNISDSALPLLLISIFGFLLSKRNAYKEALVMYGFLALGLIGLFILAYNHYILGLIEPIVGTDREGAELFLNAFLGEAIDFKGFFTFNIFIDLFLCTLVMFFTDYTPKHIFTGKRIAIFRAFVFLPLVYEVVCIYLKIMATNRLISLPLWISPFLTTKPPVAMIMFFSMIRYIKIHEKRFLATGRSLEQYNEYCKTNIHSFRFSKHFILIILVYAALDAFLLVLLTAFHIVAVNGVLDPSKISMDEISNALNIVSEWGIGNTAKMIDLVPIILLFSYTRKHKIAMFDRLIPIVGVVLIVLVYFEGGFLVAQDWLWYNMDKLRETLAAYDVMQQLP